MRVAIACVMQESNSLAPASSQLKHFSIERGENILAAHKGTNDELGGFIDELDRLGHEAVATLSAWSIAAGVMDSLSFETIADELLDSVQAANAGALLLALHGAWVSSGYDSADAELVRRLRSRLGPAFPIVVTLDLHANVSLALIENVDALVGYRTYPHIDMAECGRKAARLLDKIVTEGTRPSIYWLPIPLLAPAQTATTDRSPIADVLTALDRELGPYVLSSSFFCAQPWLDILGVASCIVVVAIENPRIPVVMCDIGQRLWNQRRELEMDWVDPEELVDKVRQTRSRPVIVSEAFDATSGGAPGDHPGLLSSLVKYKESVSACLYLVDPVAVTRARQIGIGGHFETSLGAHYDARFQKPVLVGAKVRNLSEGVFVLKGPVFTGKRIDMGLTAVLEIGRIKVVAASNPVLVIDPELYRSQGIEPADQDVIGVKSPSLFRPAYASLLRTVLHLDMPGVCRGNLRKVPYKKIGRPIWPLDDFEWTAARQEVLCKLGTLSRESSRSRDFYSWWSRTGSRAINQN